jgi:predicted phosphohydrolase
MGLGQSGSPAETAVKVTDFFHLWSDVHLEFIDDGSYPAVISEITAVQSENPRDTLILAGDIATPQTLDRLARFFKDLKAIFPRVMYLPGNHEYYHSVSMEKMDADLRGMCSLYDIQWIGNQSIPLTNDIVVIGTTLWFRFDRDVPPLNDFRYIPDFRMNEETPNVLIDANMEFLVHELSAVAKAKKRAIVVTHHMPFGKRLWATLCESGCKYPYSKSFGFSSDTDSILKKFRHQIICWCFGHTHSYVSMRDPNTGVQFLCNPHGYPNEHNPPIIQSSSKS